MWSIIGSRSAVFVYKIYVFENILTFAFAYCILCMKNKKVFKNIVLENKNKKNKEATK